MKNTGLKNRFPDEVRAYWQDWYSCLVCFLNQFDALHHIVSPSSRLYVPGDHNRSIFNSCPIHNYKHPSGDGLVGFGHSGFGVSKPCHVGNEAWLYADENIKLLLGRVLDTLLERDYYPTVRDAEFLKTYAHLYDKERIAMLKYRGRASRPH